LIVATGCSIVSSDGVSFFVIVCMVPPWFSMPCCFTEINGVVSINKLYVLLILT
jgi:hypothetical protein